jgi:hypothetical protein
MRERSARIGNEGEARAALDVHARALGCRRSGSDGEFDGWNWHQGVTRVAWYRPFTTTIYMIDVAYHGANYREHENAQVLWRTGKSWAPDTCLYPSCVTSGQVVLAMTYYPVAVKSSDEIPQDALSLAPDQLLANFRRTAALPDGEVEVIDLGDHIPRLAGLR